MASEPPLASPKHRQLKAKSPKRPLKEPTKVESKSPERKEKMYFKSLENADTFKQHLKARHQKLQAHVGQIAQSQFDSQIVPRSVAQLSRRRQPATVVQEGGPDIFTRAVGRGPSQQGHHVT
jgi:hypothetical protein